MKNRCNELLITNIGYALSFFEGENTAVSELTDRETLLGVIKAAKRHDVAHLICHELQKSSRLSGSDFEKPINRELVLAHLRYENQIHELSSVCALLGNNRIAHIPLKGSVLRNMYPEPWMRSSCDIDILVHESDLDDACALLRTELGYTQQERGAHDIAFAAKSGVHVELHFATVEEGRAAQSRKILSDIWDHARPEKEGSFTYSLSDAMFYFYHVAHMAKHFENGGCGIRPFADLIILENAPDIDLKGRAELIGKGALASFEEHAKAIAHAWFGTGELSELDRAVAGFVINGGAFGTLDGSVVLSKAKQGSSVKFILARLFLPYARLKAIYPGLEGRKWLMPFYQIKRWWQMIFTGRLKGALSEVKRSALTGGDEVDLAQQMLRQLGL